MALLTKARLAKMYASKKSSTKARKITFDLTQQQFKELILSECCAYTGIVLTIREEFAQLQAATDVTLERVDCDKGYTVENTIAVCHAANAAKNVFDSMLRADGLVLLRRMAKAVEKLEEKAAVVEMQQYNFVQRFVIWVAERVGIRYTNTSLKLEYLVRRC